MKIVLSFIFIFIDVNLCFCQTVPKKNKSVQRTTSRLVHKLISSEMVRNLSASLIIILFSLRNTNVFTYENTHKTLVLISIIPNQERLSSPDPSAVPPPGETGGGRGRRQHTKANIIPRRMCATSHHE